MRDIQFIVFFVLATTVVPVFAYIDPGSGSAIMSLIIGFFVALGLTIKTYWYKLKALFTRPRSTDYPKAETEKTQEG